ncbi:MAG: GDP-mannose 4,6-dehydratase [Nitrosomonas ureae]
MENLLTRKQSVLVTGGAGFIGSHLCEHLLNYEYNVVAIDNLSTGSLKNIQHLHKQTGFQFVRESITNALVMDRLASASDIIIHLAAAVGVQLIVDDPVHTIETNITGTEAVLKAANRYGCKVLLASTSEVYGKGVRVPFREDDDRLMGSTTRSRWAYATSKAVDEFLGLAYYHQFGLPVVILRFFNTVGPRQSGRYGMVIPRFVHQALRNEPLTIYGDGTQSRCFGFVEDIVEIIISLMQQPGAVGQVFNIGSTEEVTIQELAQRIIKLTGSNSELIYIPYERAYGAGFEDMQRRVPALDKLQDLIGYKPTTPLDTILKQVIDYEHYVAISEANP